MLGSVGTCCLVLLRCSSSVFVAEERKQESECEGMDELRGAFAFSFQCWTKAGFISSLQLSLFCVSQQQQQQRR